MANKYHDETGKFCSREQMGAAIDRVAGSGDFQKALEMERERATFDREEAAKVTAFYKATTETLASSYGYQSNQRPFSSSSPQRDFTGPINAATTPEQLREVMQLAGEQYFGGEDNLDAAWASPAADGAIRAELLRYSNTLVGQSSAQHALKQLPARDVDAIDDQLDESDPDDRKLRGEIIGYLSEARAKQLVLENPKAYAPAHARRRPYDATLRDQFLDYAKADADGEYNVWADEVVEKVAQHDPSDKAFKAALAFGDEARAAAGKNVNINVNRAQDLVTAQSFDGFVSLKKALKDNKQTPLVVKQALDAKPVPLGSEASEARLAAIAAWKEEAAGLERARLYGTAGQVRAKATRALAKSDAAPVAFAKLSKRWETAQANFVKGSAAKPSKTYVSVKERYENALTYQQIHTAKSAVERLARTPEVRISNLVKEQTWQA